MKTKQTDRGFWAIVWGMGLAGQLCWNMENQWFNTFVYAKIAKDSSIVTLMVITSALVTTFSTFLFGTLSDRLGSRRRFISLGYIVWGVFTILFGMTEYLAGGSVSTGAKLSIWVAVMVILADDVMSFFGSMANDASFSAWTNDWTTDQNRGQIGAALAIHPILGTIVGTVLGGMLVGDNNNYSRLFWVMGLFVILMGVVSLIFLTFYRVKLKPRTAKIAAWMAGGVFEGYLLSRLFDVWIYGEFKQWHEPQFYPLILLVITVPVFLCSVLMGKGTHALVELLLKPFRKKAPVKTGKKGK